MSFVLSSAFATERWSFKSLLLTLTIPPSSLFLFLLVYRPWLWVFHHVLHVISSVADTYLDILLKFAYSFDFFADGDILSNKSWTTSFPSDLLPSLDVWPAIGSRLFKKHHLKDCILHYCELLSHSHHFFPLHHWYQYLLIFLDHVSVNNSISIIIIVACNMNHLSELSWRFYALQFSLENIYHQSENRVFMLEGLDLA